MWILHILFETHCIFFLIIKKFKKMFAYIFQLKLHQKKKKKKKLYSIYS